MSFRKCPQCGANLDPGERCEDCEDEYYKRKPQKVNKPRKAS